MIHHQFIVELTSSKTKEEVDIDQVEDAIKLALTRANSELKHLLGDDVDLVLMHETSFSSPFNG